MDKQAIAEKVKTRTTNGKIACVQALRISEEEGVSSKDLGALLNELKVKVADCQLGCFNGLSTCTTADGKRGKAG
jgi:hypothetical protein